METTETGNWAKIFLSFYKNLLSASCVPGSEVGAGNTDVTKMTVTDLEGSSLNPGV